MINAIINLLKRIKAKIRKLTLILTGKVNHLKKRVKCGHTWYGSKYGGYYVCPELLNEKSIIYSFGIGEDISFDKTLINKYNCSVFCFDPTPKSINWMKRQELPEGLHFFEFGIGTKSGLYDFYLPNNPENVSSSAVIQNNIDFTRKITVKMKSLADICNELGHKHIDILKIDIEGAEYDVIENILSTNISITQLLVEFHDRLVENGITKGKQIIKKLISYNYGIFAVSDSFEEISFINRNALI